MEAIEAVEAVLLLLKFLLLALQSSVLAYKRSVFIKTSSFKGF